MCVGFYCANNSPKSQWLPIANVCFSPTVLWMGCWWTGSPRAGLQARGWVQGCIPELRLEDQQPLECALLMQDGRGTRAGQKLCSKRAHGRFAYIPRVGAGHMAKLKGSGVGKGRRNPSWKTTESVAAWQQHRMLDGGGVLSGLGPGRDSASGSGSISIPGSQASSVRGPVASGTLFSSSNWLNLASVAFK